MLPGFRFLFATVVLAVSVLVFGLGAAALLRAAHEEFASLPSWRLAQQPLLAPQFEMRAPTLAMLRIEAPAPRSMVETMRSQPAYLQAPYLSVIIPDAPRRKTVRHDVPDVSRDLPQTEPVEVVTPVNMAPPSGGTIGLAQQPPTASAPVAETLPGLNAQASIAVPATVEPPAQQHVAESRPAESNPTETIRLEAIQPETKQPEPKQPEPEQAMAKSSPTEASEPTSPETIPALVRSSEATASDELPSPVVKKATRSSARAIARRRLAIARARERSRGVLQQQGHNPDPFTQIFGGSGGGNVPRPKSG